METLFRNMPPDGKEEAKQFIFRNEIPQLFESLTAGLLHHRPAYPVEFVQDCLDSIRPNPGQPNPTVRWATFIDWKPAADSRTQSRLASSKSGPAGRKSRVSTADSGYRETSSASAVSRATSHSATSGRSRVQVTPEVPNQGAASTDAKRSSGQELSSGDRMAEKNHSGESPWSSSPGKADVLNLDDERAQGDAITEADDDDFDPTNFQEPYM